MPQNICSVIATKIPSLLCYSLCWHLSEFYHIGDSTFLNIYGVWISVNTGPALFTDGFKRVNHLAQICRSKLMIVTHVHNNVKKDNFIKRKKTTRKQDFFFFFFFFSVLVISKPASIWRLVLVLSF